MLPKKHRLTKKKDFEVVFKQGKSVKNGFLIARAVKNNLPESRFGFVVSKKVSAKATVRNKVKRRLRSAIESVLKDAKSPHDVVIVALPAILDKKLSDIQQGVINSLQRIQCLNS